MLMPSICPSRPNFYLFSPCSVSPWADHVNCPMNTLAYWLPVGIGQWEAPAVDQREGGNRHLFRVGIAPGHQGLAVSFYQRPQLPWGSLHLLVTPSSLCVKVRSSPGSPTFGSLWGIETSLASFIKLCLHFCTDTFWVSSASCQTSAGSHLGCVHTGFFSLSLSSDGTPSGRPCLTTHCLTAHPRFLPPALYSSSQHIFNFLHYNDHNYLCFVLLFHTFSNWTVSQE